MRFQLQADGNVPPALQEMIDDTDPTRTGLKRAAVCRRASADDRQRDEAQCRPATTHREWLEVRPIVDPRGGQHRAPGAARDSYRITRFARWHVVRCRQGADPARTESCQQRHLPTEARCAGRQPCLAVVAAHADGRAARREPAITHQPRRTFGCIDPSRNGGPRTWPIACRGQASRCRRQRPYRRGWPGAH